jgi:hypothetical protein
MKCLCIGAFLLLVGSSALRAQQPEIAPDTQVDDTTLHQWLRSGDPRLVAWAADFARRTDNSTIIAEMPDVLEHTAIPPDEGACGAQDEHCRALEAILDALIQRNATVPISTIRTVWHAFPAQAAILISRLPLSESGDILRSWTSIRTGSRFEMLPRIATMILAKEPERDLVSSVVAASEEELDVTIESRNSKDEVVFTADCGDSTGAPLAAGWPAVFVYAIEETNPINNLTGANVEIINLAGDRIVAFRRQTNSSWGSCGDVEVEALDSVTRHRLISYWLGVPDKDLAWQPVKRFTIVWTGKVAYEQRLGQIVETERTKLHAAVRALQGKELLPDNESAAMPQLVVNIHCDINETASCPLK